MIKLKIKKKYAFLSNIILVLISIVLIFLILEITLAFYAPKENTPIKPFLKIYDDGQFIYFNPAFVCSNYKVPLLKENNTIRLIVIGESSAFLLCSLEHMKGLLKTKYPQYNFEVVNFGVPGATTGSMVTVIGKAISYNPDIIIFYLGNNEFIEYSGNPRWFMEDPYSPLNSRSFAFILKRIHNIQMKVIHSDNMRNLLEWMFKKNLKKMVKEIKSSSAKLIIANVPVNLASPPFGSNGFSASVKNSLSSNYTKYKDTEEWLKDIQPKNELVNKLSSGLTQLESGSRKDSIKIFKELSSEIDKQDPFLEYYLAKIYYSQNNFEKARLHFQIASDIDDKPFKATTDINLILKEVAEDQDIPVIDLISRIEKESLHGIMGYGLFIDHVHLNVRGSEIVQEELASSLSKMIK